MQMQTTQRYQWAWVERRVEATVAVWNGSMLPVLPGGRRYNSGEQQRREDAYDEGMRAVEREIRQAPRNRAERLETQDRIVAAFGRFSATALDLDDETVEVLTNDFLPVGTKLARWARQFDASLSMADITQACRNAWTACGLQPLLGLPVRLTPSILGYSFLYPYSDNFLDQEDVSPEAKLQFSQRFRCLLRGEDIAGLSVRESALRALIGLIEREYPRARYPHVFDALLAIHQAQEQSIQQVARGRHYDCRELLRMSCAKGGSSVLADACLARDGLTEEESRFAFEWGVLLQLGDDLQDVREDMRRGSWTLFSQAAASGEPLDALVMQLLQFSERVGRRMDGLPHGSKMLKELLKMSWRSLIVRAVADSQEYFSARFVQEAEQFSAFRFAFLRERQQRLAGRQGLYAMLFEAFLETPERVDDVPGVPWSALGAGLPGSPDAAFR